METESKQQRLIQKMGERAGLGIIALFAIVFMSFQAPEQASSQEVSKQTLSPKVESKQQETAHKIDNYPQVAESTTTPTPTNSPTPTPTVKHKPTDTPAPRLTTPTPTSIPTQAPTITPTPTLEPTQTPQVNASVIEDEIWEKLAACESGGNWSIDTGNGYYGGLQFSQGAWESVGGSGNPAHASREEQIMRGKMLRDARGGYAAWGLCAVQLGLN